MSVTIAQLQKLKQQKKPITALTLCSQPLAGHELRLNPLSMPRALRAKLAEFVQVESSRR